VSSDALVEVRDLAKQFPYQRGPFGRSKVFVRAVDGVSFDIRKGETLGLVGESGCGKSTVGRLLLRLLEPTRGEVRFEGKNIFDLPGEELRQLRQHMQIVFQDPYASLNPRLPVVDLIAEPLVTHQTLSRAEKERAVAGLMTRVGLRPAFMSRYPHQFSGGQRQRIGIARALSINPKLVICDEPVSALDVSMRSQVLNLLGDLQQEFALTYLFISHDLSVVKHISNRVVVMYLGKIVEVGETLEFFRHPAHPYTQSLLTVIPVADPHRRERQRRILEGDVPSPINPPSGCRFRTRCPYAEARCAAEEPVLRDLGGGHLVACHLE
jgi:oligopeptide/dipeptide ABC transporter ATP-binding protein